MGSATKVSVADPFSLVKESCMFGIRSIFIIIHTWIEMLRAAMYFQLNAFWRIMIWAIAILSLPVRALTALQREKMVSSSASCCYYLKISFVVVFGKDIR